MVLALSTSVSSCIMSIMVVITIYWPHRVVLMIVFVFFKNVLFKKFFFYVWQHWVFVAAPGLSRGELGLPSHCGVGASHCSDFSWYHSWALEHELSSCGAWALAAQQHVESSRTRDRTCVPCIGSQILNHWTTRESLFWRLNEMIFIKHTAQCLSHTKLLFSKPKLMDPFS